MSSPDATPKGVQITLATQYQIANEQRVVVLTGRDQFALNDTRIALPFALLKRLAGSLQIAEGEAEMARQGVSLQTATPPTIQPT